jgi:hypothetical protein
MLRRFQAEERSMKTVYPLLLVLTLIMTTSCNTPPSAPETQPRTEAEAEPDIDPQADEILRQMGMALRDTQAFSFEVTAFYDEVLPTGLTVQFDQTLSFKVKRPNRLRVELAGGDDHRLLTYDGKAVTLHEKNLNLYGTAEAPATIDATLDMLIEDLGITLPVSDLLFSDAYGVLIENAEAGSYLGTTRFDGVEVHHMVFSQDGLDWQIWIETGSRALPRRIVLTYPEAEGAPRYEATLSGWNLTAAVSDADFTTAVPADAERIDFQKNDELEDPK